MSKTKTFKNKAWDGKRNYECTNVVACIAEHAPDASWIECDDRILNGLTQLWIIRDVRYFGYL